MSEHRDEDLVQSFQTSFHGANEAFWELHARHAPKLLAFLKARVSRGSEAEDIHQEIWMRVWRTLQDRFHGGNFRAWLYQVARNCHLDWERKQRKHRQEVAFDEGQPLPSDWARGEVGSPGAAQEWEEEQRQAIRRCLQELEGQNADAHSVVRARMTGEGYDEICARMGLRPERAHKLFHEAKQHLKQCTERIMQ
jgi:RNA polymerase sigma-70 factor (ECF subfamily)